MAFKQFRSKWVTMEQKCAHTSSKHQVFDRFVIITFSFSLLKVSVFNTTIFLFSSSYRRFVNYWYSSWKVMLPPHLKQLNLNFHCFYRILFRSETGKNSLQKSLNIYANAKSLPVAIHPVPREAVYDVYVLCIYWFYRHFVHLLCFILKGKSADFTDIFRICYFWF